MPRLSYDLWQRHIIECLFGKYSVVSMNEGSQLRVVRLAGIITLDSKASIR